MTKSIIAFLRYITVWALPSRMNRIRYFVLVNIYITALIVIPATTIVAASGFKASIPSLIVFLSPVVVFIFISFFVLMVKRLHDINLNGAWVLLFVIPLFKLVLLFAEGTKGANRFGSQPKKASKLEYVLAVIFVPLYIILAYIIAVVR